MLQPNFTPFPKIETERLLLRNITKDDAAVILFLRSDEKMMQYVDKEKFQNIQAAEDLIERINTSANNNEGITWGISLKNEPTKLIGTIGFWRIIAEHYRAEIGYALHTGHWHNGIMDEAIKAVLLYGFTTMKLHSVEANINPSNTASEALLQKNGFIKEAHFKEDYFFDGRFLDSVIYSLLAPK